MIVEFNIYGKRSVDRENILGYAVLLDRYIGILWKEGDSIYYDITDYNKELEQELETLAVKPIVLQLKRLGLDYFDYLTAMHIKEG